MDKLLVLGYFDLFDFNFDFGQVFIKKDLFSLEAAKHLSEDFFQKTRTTCFLSGFVKITNNCKLQIVFFRSVIFHPEQQNAKLTKSFMQTYYNFRFLCAKTKQNKMIFFSFPGSKNGKPRPPCSKQLY